MFNDVGGGGAALKNLEALEDGRYFVRLKELRDEGEQPQFTKVRDDGTTYIPRSVRWTFQLGRDINTPVYGIDGEIVEMRAWTSEATGPKSSARPWMEALLQRKLVTGDKGAELAALLPAKVAWAMIVVNREVDNQSGLLKIRPKILSMTPYTQGVPVAAQPLAEAPALAAAAAGAAPLPWA